MGRHVPLRMVYGDSARLARSRAEPGSGYWVRYEFHVHSPVIMQKGCAVLGRVEEEAGL